MKDLATNFTMRMDVNRAAEHLAAAIRFKTISHQDQSKLDRREFTALHSYLRVTYPLLHRMLTREIVNDLSLLYTWKGSNEGAEPILLMAHLDVVPVEQGTENDWVHPPFAGVIDKDFVWGRGALDIKNSVIGLMEAVECLLRDGFAPTRTIYLAFGHDEEVIGMEGAAEISRTLRERGVRLAYVLDEGGFIRIDGMPGVKKPVAMVAVAEKGYLTLELVVNEAGGHSGMPPRRTAVGRVAAALCRLERNPFPARLTCPVRAMFESLGREAAPPYRYVYANIRLFKPVVMSRLSASPQSNAMIRTTIAPTMLKGSDKENMMPRSVSAVINIRILPDETRESVTARVKNVINDPGIIVMERKNSSDPSPVSDVRSPEYIALKNTILDLFPDTVVAPFLMVAATDSRHFASISRQILRFSPSRLSQEDMNLIHGTGERISIKNLEEIMTFYAELIRRTAL
ncbi:MAG: hypothetical protein A2176_03355 [Spirochaetes bacterium RBG_13_51_14]|nr:MAG: hypothetical protein A2176_03355 [Spirochaetes bacterium RBG_13_51_14]